MNELRLENLKINLLQPVSFEVGAGECVVISGSSGSGKSLLLRAIAELDPHEGDVSLDGSSCSAMPANVWRTRVGLMPAESQWWSNTVGEHFRNCNEQYLSLLGFTPEVMQWRVDRLSSGEKQRLSLLRLLCREPEVLLLDEPTANLDAESVEKLEALIRQYCKDRNAAIIWVSHDREQIRRMATRHYRIRSGALEEVSL